MKTAWLIQNLVPYHHARFHAFGKLKDVDATLIEVTNIDAFKVLEYSPAETSYRRHILFPGRQPETIDMKSLTAALHHYLAEQRFDVLCVSGWGLNTGLSTALFASRCATPLVVFSESNQFDRSRNFFVEWIKRRIVGLFDAGLAGGHPQQEYLELLGMDAERIFLGHNVVDSSHFKVDTPPPIDAPYFFACARLEEKKNYFRLLEAYARYAAGQPAPWPLKIAGDGVLRPEVEKTIVRLGLQNNVQLLGAVAYAGIADLYRGAGCFIHASSTEQWGLVVNEAMAAGNPILVSERCGCASDLVRDGINGYRLNPLDVDDIAGKMKLIAELPDETRDQLRRQSLKLIADWGPDRFAAGLHAAARVALSRRDVPKKQLDRWALELLCRTR